MRPFVKRFSSAFFILLCLFTITLSMAEEMNHHHLTESMMVDKRMSEEESAFNNTNNDAKETLKCEKLLNYLELAEGLFSGYEARGEKLFESLKPETWRKEQISLKEKMEQEAINDDQCEAQMNEIESFLAIFGMPSIP